MPFPKSLCEPLIAEHTCGWHSSADQQTHAAWTLEPVVQASSSAAGHA